MKNTFTFKFSYLSVIWHILLRLCLCHHFNETDHFQLNGSLYNQIDKSLPAMLSTSSSIYSDGNDFVMGTVGIDRNNIVNQTICISNANQAIQRQGFNMDFRHISGMSAFSFSFWVRVDSQPPNGMLLISTQPFNQSDSQITVNNQSIPLTTFSFSTDRVILNSASIPLRNSNRSYPLTENVGVWKHVVFVKSTRDISQVYVNGVLEVQIGQFEADEGFYADFLQIGAQPLQDDAEFNGCFDEIRFHNVTLTQAQVKNLFLANEYNFPYIDSLLVYYRFDGDIENQLNSFPIQYSQSIVFEEDRFGVKSRSAGLIGADGPFTDAHQDIVSYIALDPQLINGRPNIHISFWVKFDTDPPGQINTLLSAVKPNPVHSAIQKNLDDEFIPGVSNLRLHPAFKDGQWGKIDLSIRNEEVKFLAKKRNLWGGIDFPSIPSWTPSIPNPLGLSMDDLHALQDLGTSMGLPADIMSQFTLAQLQTIQSVSTGLGMSAMDVAAIGVEGMTKIINAAKDLISGSSNDWNQIVYLAINGGNNGYIYSTTLDNTLETLANVYGFLLGASTDDKRDKSVISRDGSEFLIKVSESFFGCIDDFKVYKENLDLDLIQLLYTQELINATSTCDPTCRTCTGHEETDCTSCDRHDDMYFLTSQGRCTKCNNYKQGYFRNDAQCFIGNSSGCPKYAILAQENIDYHANICVDYCPQNVTINGTNECFISVNLTMNFLFNFTIKPTMKQNQLIVTFDKDMTKQFADSIDQIMKMEIFNLTIHQDFNVTYTAKDLRNYYADITFIEDNITLVDGQNGTIGPRDQIVMFMQASGVNATQIQKTASFIIGHQWVLTQNERNLISITSGLATASWYCCITNLLTGGSGAAKSVTNLGLVELLKMQNIDYPPQVTQTFQSIVPFPPNFMTGPDTFPPDNIFDVAKLPNRFVMYGYSPYFFTNQGEELFQMILFLFIGYMIVYAHAFYYRNPRLQKQDEKAKEGEDEQSTADGAVVQKNINLENKDKQNQPQNQQQQLAQRAPDFYAVAQKYTKIISGAIHKFVVWNFVSALIIGNYMGGCLAANIGIFYMPLNSGWAIFNYIVCIFYFFFNILFLLHYFLLVRTADRIKWAIKEVRYQRGIINAVQKKEMVKKYCREMSRKELFANDGAFWDSQSTWNKLQRYYYPKTEEERKDFLVRYLFLYSDFKDVKQMQRYFAIFDLTRIFLVSFIITALPAFPMFQAVINTIILAVYIIMLLLYRPFESTVGFIIVLLIETIVFLAFLFAAIIQLTDSFGIFDNNNPEDIQQKKLLGNLMVFVTMQMGFISTIQFFLSVYGSLKDMYDIRKEQIERQKNPQENINLDDQDYLSPHSSNITDSQQGVEDYDNHHENADQNDVNDINNLNHSQGSMDYVHSQEQEQQSLTSQRNASQMQQGVNTQGGIQFSQRPVFKEVEEDQNNYSQSDQDIEQQQGEEGDYSINSKDENQ